MAVYGRLYKVFTVFSEYINMTTLTKQQIERQDFVDNQIFELVQRLMPAAKINWDIEMIGNVRDLIQTQLIDKQKVVSENQFYPYLKI